MYIHRLKATLLLTLSVSIMSCNLLGDDAPSPGTAEVSSSSELTQNSESSTLSVSQNDPSDTTSPSSVESSSMPINDSTDASSGDGVTDESSLVSESSSSVDGASEIGLSSSIDYSAMSYAIDGFKNIEVTQNENTKNSSEFSIAPEGYTEYFKEGDFLKFSSVYFGEGVNTVSLKIGLENAGSSIALRIDSEDGPLIGVILPKVTDGWITFIVQDFLIEETKGVHDLYVLAHHPVGAGNIRYLTFSNVERPCNAGQLCDPELEYSEYIPTGSELVIPRSDYLDRIHGMWLGECVANWTGIVTEMDHTEAPFYVESDWGTVDPINMFETWDQENIPFYNDGKPPMIDYVYQYGSDPWASDDDTDIEYIYQHLLDVNNSSVLTGDQIREGWLSHIDGSYVWVSNENAYNLMKSGVVPPETSDPNRNWGYEQIDAQLTTEIFGMFAPANPTVALKMSHLPILTTARYNAQWISEFYVIMYSLAAFVEYHQDHAGSSMHDKLKWMADKAAERLPSNSFSRDMYDFVKLQYEADSENWEATRDALYERYQLGGGNVPNYTYAGRAEAGINFAAGLISLYYGNGDIKRTIKVGALCGWDSDNPTATWGGLFGFMLGKEAVVKAFGESDLSETYNILRTRVALPDHTPGVAGQDSFPLLAQRGIYIIDRAVIEEMGGGVNLDNDTWYIPEFNGVIEEGTSHY